MHTILWRRSGTHDGTDWKDEQTITFQRKRKGFEIVALHPGAGYHGVFSDLADRILLDEAQDWLDNEGYDEAKSLLTGPLPALGLPPDRRYRVHQQGRRGYPDFYDVASNEAARTEAISLLECGATSVRIETL